MGTQARVSPDDGQDKGCREGEALWDGEICDWLAAGRRRRLKLRHTWLDRYRRSHRR
jgi:hypothetical protein